jgi:hypothetical protein
MSENPVREEERAAGYTYSAPQIFDGPVTFNGPVIGIPMGTPSLPLNSLQFNNAGAFGGSADCDFVPNTRFRGYVRTNGGLTLNRVEINTTTSQLSVNDTDNGIEGHVSVRLNGIITSEAEIKADRSDIVSPLATITSIDPADALKKSIVKSHTTIASIETDSSSGSGNVSINSVVPSSPAISLRSLNKSTLDETRIQMSPISISVVGLKTFANNAAALVGGLVANDLYAVTASDPRTIAIVF